MSQFCQDWMNEFHAALPPPPQDTPEAIAARRVLATIHLDSLGADDPHEIALAIQHVLCWWSALSALQSGYAARKDDPAHTRHCQKQYASMSRESRASLRLLRMAQGARGYQPVAPGMEPAEAATEPPAPAPAPAPDATAAAEDFARRFPTRATRIRRAKGMPPGATFALPPDPILAALINGTTKTLRRLDRIPA